MKATNYWYFGLLRSYFAWVTLCFIFILTIFIRFAFAFTSIFVILLLGRWSHICTRSDSTKVVPWFWIRFVRMTHYHRFRLLWLRRLNSRSVRRSWVDWIDSMKNCRLSWALRTIFIIAHINNSWISYWLNLLGYESFFRLMRPRYTSHLVIIIVSVSVLTHIHTWVCLVS
jgi:hypothetical protein